MGGGVLGSVSDWPMGGRMVVWGRLQIPISELVGIGACERGTALAEPENLSSIRRIALTLHPVLKRIRYPLPTPTIFTRDDCPFPESHRPI